MTRLILFLATCCLLNSCALDKCGATKDDFLKKYNGLISEVKDKDLSYSDDDWQKYDNRFRGFIEDCYDKHEADLSLRERRKFWGKALTYYYKRYGTGMAKELGNKDNPISKTIRDHVDQFSDNPRTAIRELLGEVGGEEVDDLLKDLEKDLNKWGQKLENLFKKK